MGILASIGGWLLGILLDRSTGNVLDKALGHLVGSDSGQEKLAEIQAKATVAMKHEETEQAKAYLAAINERQRAKMNQPVFWIIIAVMMGPPALILWGVAIYNILWWQHGIWPQGWAIADFPPSIKPWVEKSIDWLYDPIAAPATVGAAAVASILTGRRR